MIKQEFQKWLKNDAKKANGDLYSDSTVYKYYSSIDVLNREFELDFWNFTSFENLIYKRDKLYEDHDFIQKNITGNHMYSRAVETLIDFIYSKGIKELKADINKIEKDNTLSYDEKNSYIESICNIRNPQFQHNFRKELLKEFSGKCAICDINDARFLIASHIIPYSDCKIKSEMYRSYNGLLLCVAHDALFDKHFITFDENGNILINNTINKSLYEFLNINTTQSLDNKYLTNERQECLLSHNSTVNEKHD